ncbi:hypothetical protein M9458_055897, partial [Cirrhinus mrigala]
LAVRQPRTWKGSAPPDGPKQRRLRLLWPPVLFRPQQPASTTCVGGIVVSIAAFQAVDPGSIPGQRISFLATAEVEAELLL